MKIITVNIPRSDIEKIKQLVGIESMYPSRSEMFRVAIKNFIIREKKRFMEIEEPVIEIEKQSAEKILQDLCKDAQQSYEAKLIKNGVHHE